MITQTLRINNLQEDKEKFSSQKTLFRKKMELNKKKQPKIKRITKLI